MEREKLGTFLKKMREAKGLSLRDLAKLSKEMGHEGDKSLTYSHISKIEKGETSPTIRTLQKFAEALDLPLVVILEGGKADPDTVTILSTTQLSQELVKTLNRRELAQLLVFCRQLTDEQIASVLGVARSIYNASQLKGETESPQK